jgi:hypothetical protein
VQPSAHLPLLRHAAKYCHNAWHNETEAILPPEFRSQFESSAGMTFFGSQYKDYSRLNNDLIGRLTRLGEIIGQI